MHEMNFQFILGVEKAFSFACQMTLMRLRYKRKVVALRRHAHLHPRKQFGKLSLLLLSLLHAGDVLRTISPWLFVDITATQ